MLALNKPEPETTARTVNQEVTGPDSEFSLPLSKPTLASAAHSFLPRKKLRSQFSAVGSAESDAVAANALLTARRPGCGQTHQPKPSSTASTTLGPMRACGERL
ncbi:hypothetical protein F0562_006156 [Nyssa sinensis]|uniref:Uncharacterized protein n=1 Tax=Nyssa sinensis TaxID=561372 RepID=A0A5J5AR47_9ASTE|nr:hypothetical protein F0562_006156 [Nyssa sinensis]